MKIRPVLFALLLTVLCIYAKAVSEELDTSNNETEQTTESSEPEEQPDPLDKLSRLVPFIETHEFNYTQYLQEPEEERVLIGTNTPLYIAKYNEETEKVKYRAYHYPEPQRMSSCGHEQHQKLSPKEHVESEKTYHEVEDIVYPEILVVVDHSLYKKYGENVFKIAEVAAVYWNSVDLLYRTMKSPKIRLNIAGLIIPESPEAIPYVEKNYNHDLGSFDDFKVIDDMYEYFAKDSGNLDGIPEDSFDVVFLMTNRFNKNGNDGVASHVGELKRTVAYIGGEFEHDFYYVMVGAHELGHLLNADEDRDSGCLNSPYIMGGDALKRKHGFAWSQCSLRDISQFLNKPENKYLGNRPNIGKPHPRPRDKVEDCTVQYCAKRNAETDYEVEEIETDLPPLHGTSCGCGKICFHGKCVEDQE
ncbi:hypothetical protein TKK_0006248 [Trichogramma kaykai]